MKKKLMPAGGQPRREGGEHMNIMDAFNSLDRTFKVLVIALIVLVS